MDPLSPIAGRVLGSLLEKEVTVPSTYPLTMNALITACNQTSGRDPVLALSEAEVQTAIDELRTAGLARVVHASHGSRTAKYRQVADEALGLAAPERAVLTVLVLRGAQTPGELRSRSERLHRFEGVVEVEEVLRTLAAREPSLVVELPRRPGQKEQRWAQTLTGPPSATAAEDGRPASAGAAATSSPPPASIGPEVALLAAFVGTWRGSGEGEYPTIEPFAYTEEIEIRPVPGKPLLAYRSTTRHADDGRGLHGESGWFRVVGRDRVELVVAQGPGIVEVAEGIAGDGEVLLASTVVAGSTTAKEVLATERRYRVTSDELVYDLAMAAVGVPLTHHLHATLRRAAP